MQVIDQIVNQYVDQYGSEQDKTIRLIFEKDYLQLFNTDSDLLEATEFGDINIVDIVIPSLVYVLAFISKPIVQDGLKITASRIGTYLRFKNHHTLRNNAASYSINEELLQQLINIIERNNQAQTKRLTLDENLESVGEFVL